ncbi:MAG: hypothetical protein M0021_10960 [Clostridia bacterium]|nr:hypothetical protein [Clostridia bacterium]
MRTMQVRMAVLRLAQAMEDRGWLGSAGKGGQGKPAKPALEVVSGEYPKAAGSV